MRPMPLFDSTMIRFSQGKPSSYRPYTDHLEAFMKSKSSLSNLIVYISGYLALAVILHAYCMHTYNMLLHAYCMPIACVIYTIFTCRPVD